MNPIINIVDPSKWESRYEGTSVPLDLVILDEYQTELELAFGERVACMYYSDVQEPPVFYKSEFVYLDLWGVSYRNYAEMREPEMVKQFSSRIQECIDQENYDLLLHLIPSRFKMGALIDNIQAIPIEKQYDLFRHAYVKSEFGMKQLNCELTLSLISVRHYSDACKQSLEKLREQADEKGILTVYRGEGRLSTPLKEALSWTLSKAVARFFALRFENQGIIYTAQIHIDDVFDYITQGNEEELLLFFTKTKNILKESIYRNEKDTRT